MIGIYKITSPTGKIYIGQSIDIKRRFLDHRNLNNISTNGKLQNSLKSHGPENHIFEILEECEIENLNERERHYQDLYDVLSENGLNLVLTETGTKRQVVSVETRKKLSLLATGRGHSEETKLRLRNFNLGKTHSEETKRKCSLTTLRYTDESRRKMKVARENRTEEVKLRSQVSIINSWKNLSPEDRQKRIKASVEGRRLSELNKLNRSK